MRVFYTEEADDKPVQYFVTIENITIPDNLKGTKAFEADSIAELKNKIIAYYGFTLPDTIELQLWSGPTGASGIQINDNKVLLAHNTIWVRAAATSTNNKETI
jgi:hypothetical protein